MPLCTTCAEPLSYLYTIYDTANNLRLEPCPHCGAFADPYIEHDDFSLLLDIILLKREVYRHLLFNRGFLPKTMANSDKFNSAMEQTFRSNAVYKERWKSAVKIGGVLILLDSFIRWSRAYSPEDLSLSDEVPLQACLGFLVAFFVCLCETLAFHAGIILSSTLVLHLTGRNKDKSQDLKTKAPHVSLALFYSSVAKLFLLLLLSVWKVETIVSDYTTTHTNSSLRYLNIDDMIDREWIIRNLLGGMSAGFGLRVILDCHPLLMTVIILLGWTAKSCMAILLNSSLRFSRYSERFQTSEYLVPL